MIPKEEIIKRIEMIDSLINDYKITNKRTIEIIEKEVKELRFKIIYGDKLL
jgi:hypothetical protein